MGAAPATRSGSLVDMNGTPAERNSGAERSVKVVLWKAGWWLGLVVLIDIGVGLLLGSGMWWLGWTHPPIKDFFVTLAGIGGALLVAYSVTVTQVLPVFVRHAVRGKTVNITTGQFAQVFGFALGVALAAVVGIGACLALVREPLSQAHWWLMGLFGVGVFTLAVLGAAIGLGTMLYVFLFFEE
jgi:hypothetical protein